MVKEIERCTPFTAITITEAFEQDFQCIIIIIIMTNQKNEKMINLRINLSFLRRRSKLRFKYRVDYNKMA